MLDDKLYEYKTIKNQGAYLYLIRLQNQQSWKLHRWDGPAVSPFNRNSPHSLEYYLNGINYDYESYNEIMREREGLPFYKNSSMKHLLSDYRN